MEPAAVSFNSFDRRGNNANHYANHSFDRRGDNANHSYRFRPKRNPNQTMQYADEDLLHSSRDAMSDGSKDVFSNIQSFLQHTTPRVPSQFLSKTCLKGLCSQGSIECEKNFFTLSDIWNSYDEWSAYGAGVPILLSMQETVMQYYVPYLSAIQLYASAQSDLTSKSRRRLGDDSDCSEMDYRDSNSETSSSDGEVERLSDPAAWSSLDIRERTQQCESLLFEYFESASPSQRVPLFDKIKDLAVHFPGLKTLCSNEISESSWLSVAWYPIYRIPTGPTLQDLTACFLTYHSLSTLFTGGSAKTIPNTMISHPVRGTEMVLYPFGLAGYKFRGPVWSLAGANDRHQTMLLQRSSHDWLKRLHVCHPDFDYFMSRLSLNYL